MIHLSTRSSKIAQLFALIIFVCASFILFILKALVFGAGGANSRSGASPVRWMVATLLPLFITIKGIRRNLFTRSGALLALAVSFFLTLAHWSFLFSLLVYYFTSLKFGKCQNWINILTRTGVATELALVYLLDEGSADLPIDFRRFYRTTWLGIAILGSISSCVGDIWAARFARGEARLITSFEIVSPGTPGAVSAFGLLASFCGGIFVGSSFYVGVIFGVQNLLLLKSPSQISIIFVGGIGGLLGSILDSFLGAVFQCSNISQDSTVAIGDTGSNNNFSGFHLLDNHGVNLVSSILTATILPKIAMSFF